MSCQELQGEIAVAVLRGRPLTDDVVGHLAACPACAQEYARLAALPDLLSTTRDDTLPPVVAAEPAMLDRLLDVVRRRRRRRRAWAAAASAASVALVALLAAPLATTLWRDAAAPRPAASGSASASPSGSTSGPLADEVSRGMARDARTGAGASVVVRKGAWGSDLEVRMTGLAAGRQCRMVVVDAVGHRTPGGSWTIPTGGYRDQPGFHETVSTAPRAIVRVEILDDTNGSSLVTVDLKPV